MRRTIGLVLMLGLALASMIHGGGVAADRVRLVISTGL